MKHLWTILFFAFPLTHFAQEKAKIGMTADEVKKIYPDIKTDANENGTTLSRPAKLYGLDGEWGYRFKEKG